MSNFIFSWPNAIFREPLWNEIRVQRVKEIFSHQQIETNLKKQGDRDGPSWLTLSECTTGTGTKITVLKVIPPLPQAEARLQKQDDGMSPAGQFPVSA